MYFLILLTMASILGIGGQNQSPASGSAQAAAPAGNTENGKKIYESFGCYQCHGYAAHGGGGPRLAPRPLAFAAFSRYVRQPTGQMPPYTLKVVSEQQLADIYAFLQTVPAPPSVDTIPILKD
jgi:mono/diheme cytochrome c family protein